MIIIVREAVICRVVGFGTPGESWEPARGETCKVGSIGSRVCWSGNKKVDHGLDMRWVKVTLCYDCSPNYRVLRKGPQELKRLQFVQELNEGEVRREQGLNSSPLSSN